MMNGLVSFLRVLFIAVFLIPTFGECTIVGVGVHFQGYKGDSLNYLKKIKELGFSSFREDYPWSGVEHEKGKYSVGDNIKKKDSAFMNAHYYGLEPILILDYGNKNYNSGDFPRDQESIKNFVNYASWTASRFKGKVKYYEIWNEWTIGTGMDRFRNSIPSAEVYFNLVKEVSLAIKKIDPNALIIAGGFNPLEQRAKFLNVTDNVWFEQLLRLGILNYIDGVSIHTYSYLNGSRRLRTVDGNLDYLDSFYDLSKKIAGRNFSIYITEIGVTNYTGPGGMSQEDSASYLKDYIQGSKKRDYIKGVWIYDLVDDGEDKRKRDFNFGLLKNDLSPKLSAPIISSLLNGK